jgi:hypothetical protein
MIINRTLYLNPVEPEILSFRFSSGIDTKVDLTYRRQNGAVHTEDIAGQLQMVGRSDNATNFYPVPATDIVNGKARVLIPAGLNHDPHGWTLRLTGTVNRESMVVAKGTAVADAGSAPMMGEIDVIDSINLNFFYGNAVNMTVKLWQDAQKYTPYDLSSTTVSAAVYAAPGGASLLPFTITAIAGNAVTLTLTAAQVNTLPGTCWWTLVVSDANGTTTLAQGTVTVTNP